MLKHLLILMGTPFVLGLVTSFFSRSPVIQVAMGVLAAIVAVASTAVGFSFAPGGLFRSDDAVAVFMLVGTGIIFAAIFGVFPYLAGSLIGGAVRSQLRSRLGVADDGVIRKLSNVFGRSSWDR